MTDSSAQEPEGSKKREHTDSVDSSSSTHTPPPNGKEAGISDMKETPLAEVNKSKTDTIEITDIERGSDAPGKAIGEESAARWEAALINYDFKIRNEKHVEIVSILVASPDLPLPLELSIVSATKSSKKLPLFSLKQGSVFSIGFKYRINNDVIIGLSVVTKIYRMGVPIQKSLIKLGTFLPRESSYVYFLPDEQAPAGPLAFGVFTAKNKFLDDNRVTYGVIDYFFKIDKDWNY